ncbi:MAG: ATP synthase F1 subunit epsilon [Phycisphaerae bacterium]
MAPFRRTFCVEAITPDGRSVTSDARSVVYPGPDGQVGVLGNHAPLIGMVGSGLFEIKDPEGLTQQYFVSGGFVQVRENEFTLLAEDLQELGEMNPEEVYEEIEKARALPRVTDEEVASREAAIKAARDKFSLVQKYRRRTRG